jgi:hypothetical protein
MQIKFALYENHLTQDPDDFMALVQDAPVATEKEIIAEMVREGSSISTAQALAVIEEYQQALVRLGQRGYKIMTAIEVIEPSISGVFMRDEPFDRNKHLINTNMRPGPRLTGLYAATTVERVEPNVIAPTLHEFIDAPSDSSNAQLTPGGAGSLRGHRLKFNVRNSDEGIFFSTTPGRLSVL